MSCYGNIKVSKSSLSDNSRQGDVIITDFEARQEIIQYKSVGNHFYVKNNIIIPELVRK